MRAMRNTKTRLVFLLTTILLFQVVSGIPQVQATNSVGYYPTNGKQKKYGGSTAGAGKSIDSVYPNIVSAAEAYLLTPESDKNQFEQLEEHHRVARQADDELAEEVKKVLASKNCLDCDIADLKPGATWKSLGADSLAQVECVVALEDKFNFDIPDDDAEKIKTVGQCIAYIRKKNAE